MPEWEDEKLWQRLTEDSGAREAFLIEYHTFIHHVASKTCFHSLEWGRDNELSEALIAFNEAIDLFVIDKGVPFLAYARVLMKRRLIDYHRRHHARQAVSLDQEDVGRAIDKSLGFDEFREHEQDRERTAEVQQFSKDLASFQLTYQNLVEVSPKHRDSRETLLRAAKELAFDKELWLQVERSGKVPMQALALKTKIHPKTLERGRKYILAVALLIANQHDYVYLREYVITRETRAKG